MENITTPPYQVRRADFINREPYHSTPGTRQQDIMLTVFVSGRGIYSNSRGRIYVGRGMAGLVPPEDRGFLTTNPEDPYSHYYCRFNGEYARQQADAIIKERASRFFHLSNVDEVADCIRKMGAVYNPELPAVMTINEVLLAQALVLMRSPLKSPGVPVLNIASLEEYMRSNIAMKPNLSRMADYFAVSRTTLCRKVKTLFGKTILEVWEPMKIQWAETLLEQTGFNVSDVSRRVGYNDPLYFSKVFKKHRGRSPSGKPGEV